jgi:putative PIG3 family NAD(P)H quinone oxidoreductase
MSHAIPETMQFIGCERPGPPDVLRIMSGPTPQPRNGEVLIRVAGASVNRPDILQREGKYAPPPGTSPIIGLDVAGEIVAVGPEVRRWRTGDRVCALVAGGGYAEYCAAPADQCLPVPEGLSLAEAGAIPETFFTVWTNLFQRARLATGESVLIHGGSSGIGTTAIQLARARGARVFATAGSAAKCAACVQLGAELAVNYHDTDFVAAVRDATAGRGVDVVLDMVGGAYVARNLTALALDGRLVQIAFLRGSRVELDLQVVMTRRLTITGSTLRPRSVAEKGAIARDLEAQVWPLLNNGTVRPILFRTFPLAEAAAAHRLLEEGRHIGKIVLQP